MSCLGKVFTSIINSRLKLYLECAGYIGDEQAGFRRGHSTNDHIFTLHAIIALYKSRKKKLFAALVDLKKAFDFVDRSILWQKVLAMNINGKVLNVIKEIYRKAKSCVKNNGILSSQFPCKSGVRQGENLSPLLFSIFMNDLAQFLHDTNDGGVYKGLSYIEDEMRNLDDEDVEVFFKLLVLLYADDTVILAESADELQVSLNRFLQYCNENNLKVNADKTKIVVFGRTHWDLFPAFLLGHERVEVVTEYLYLGIIFHQNCNFKSAIEKQISQGRKAMHAVLWKVKKLHVDFENALDLFEKVVIPVLLYGSEVWGYSNLEPLEVFL